MSSREELHVRRARLVERAGSERVELAREFERWERPLRITDRSLSFVRTLRRMPVLGVAIGAGMAALAFVRPGTIVDWGAGRPDHLATADELPRPAGVGTQEVVTPHVRRLSAVVHATSAARMKRFERARVAREPLDRSATSEAVDSAQRSRRRSGAGDARTI